MKGTRGKRKQSLQLECKTTNNSNSPNIKELVFITLVMDF